MQTGSYQNIKKMLAALIVNKSIQIKALDHSSLVS